MRRFAILALACTVFLAACGGDTITGQKQVATGSSTGSGSSGSGSGTTSTPTSLTAMSSTTSIPLDGSATATITVLARNSSNNLISGVTVSFAASAGGIAVTQAVTDSSGAATATLTASGDATPGAITVTATAAGLTATVAVQAVVAGSTGGGTAVASLTLTSSTAFISSDGSTTAAISALARDASNNVLAGVPVTFTASSGAIQVTAGTTTAAGTATATLSTGGDSSLRTITVTGTSASLSATAAVQVVAPTTPTIPVYSMGNGTGSAFASGIIGLSVSGSLAAGGTTGLQISIVDQTGTLYTGAPVVVTFNSPCIASGLSQIVPAGASTPSTTITTSSGSINATYAAVGCSGSDIITASATVDGQNVAANATVTVAAASIGSIQFISATPTTIGLKGTGLNETSTVIFKVLDSTGGPKVGVPVTFSLNTTVGGMSISPASATTASDGTVQTVVSSGTAHTVVRVTANIASPALSTQSSQLTVTTGLPASAAFSIAVGAANYGASKSTFSCPNVEAFGIDGVEVAVTVRLADRYNNPVPDGTAVAFNTNGGHIVGSCTTPDATPGDGTCAVTWTSANPRPALSSDTPDLLAAGRATVLATTIGEESFTDINGSGFWQTGDPFVNLGEPFRDDNENGVYDSGEYFLDFNQNGKRDAGTGSFVGITCTGITAGSTCSTSTLAISASELIIMSTSGAKIALDLSRTTGFTGGAGGLSIAAGASGTIAFTVVDLNGNPMPAGTTVTSTYNGTAGTYAQTVTPYVWPCDSDLGGIELFGTFTASTTATGTGSVVISVTSPNGLDTPLAIPVTVP